MNISDSNMKTVLTGIDKVHEKASATFNSIPTEALKAANVTDYTASDIAARVAKKVEPVTAPTPEVKRPTLG